MEELKGKQRRYLKSLANRLKPMVYISKLFRQTTPRPILQTTIHGYQLFQARAKISREPGAYPA